MNNKHKLWGVLIAFIALLLVACLLPPLPRSKALGSRITGINNLSSFSTTGTNALATAAPSK